MILKDIIKQGTETISRLYPEREAREMVLSYLESRVGTSRHTHIVDPGYQVPDEALPDITDAFNRMAAGEPLQYVTGKAYFYGREFNVTPDVLIPRPETEILCREIIRNAPESPRVLDLCTGSGCIAWTSALEIPDADVTAVDISDGALGVASGQDFSGEKCLISPEFIKADMLGTPLRGLGQFDVIASNPPYVMDSEKALMRKNVLDHEPHLALFVPDTDPLVFYRAVAVWALELLKKEGYGIVEINETLGPQTAEIFSGAGFVSVRILKDLNDKDRFVEFKK